MADKGVTIRELAEAAGVSIGTVSRALKGQPGLSEETRAEVLAVAQRLGYDTAKLRTGKPRRILFLYNRSIGSLATNPFYSYVMHGRPGRRGSPRQLCRRRPPAAHQHVGSQPAGQGAGEGHGRHAAAPLHAQAQPDAGR